MTRKWISMLLTLTMLLAMLPAVPVLAREPKETINMVLVNPEYASLGAANSMPDGILGEAVHPNETGTYVSVSEAGAQVREAMKQREQYIAVAFYTTESDQNTAAFSAFYAGMEHTGEPTEGDYLLKNYDSANVSGSVGRGYVDGVRVYQYDVVYTVEYTTTAAQEAEMDIAVEDLLAQLALDGLDDYHQFMAVYDYICENITYDYDNLNDENYLLKHSAYAALIHKTAVCQGYALLLYRLMLELGIDCRYISGDAGGPHGWNIVQIDGLYYNADSTWDAGLHPYQWCLLSDASFVRHTRNAEYRTDAFYKEYQMGMANYDPSGENQGAFASGVCGNSIFWELSEAGVLTISGSGSMYNYGYYGNGQDAPWAEYADMIKELDIGSRVSSIGHEAFRGLTGLTGFDVPIGVTSIGYRAFADCTGLQYVSVASDCSWTSIYAEAFSGCTGLVDLFLQNKAIVTYADQGWWDKTCLLDQVENVYVIASVTNVGEAITHGFAQGIAPLTVEVDGVRYRLYTRNTHTFVAVVTEPTCTEQGYTTYTCDQCGYSYTTDYVEPLGHTEEVIPGNAPTCTESGMTEGKKCSVCGEILVAQEEIPALGHEYKRGSCIRCGQKDPNYEGNILGLLGDINDDGKVNSSDVSILFRYVSRDATLGELTAGQLLLADVNQDGNVNSSDVSILFRYVSRDATLAWEPEEISA